MAEMPDVKDVTFKVKVVVNKQKSKVLFALVDDDFAGVLFSFLALPLGRIVRILKDHYGDNTPLIGSLNTLYNAVANLDSVYFDEGDITKAMLLDPDTPFPSKFSKLKINLNKTQQPVGIFDDWDTSNNTSFIIGDDLRVMPNMTCSVIDTLTKLGIAVTDMEETQTMLYTFGLNQIMDLLMNAFISPHPLTDIILGKGEMNSAKMKSFMLHKFENVNSSTNSKTAMMQVMLQKSTNKFLFAQTDNCFIDFLVSMLAIPLGRVELLLGRNTCLNNIDNLYRTIADYHTDIIDWLINPMLHNDSYTCKQLLPLPRKCYHFFNNNMWRYYNGHFIKGPRMFMVTNDLTVTPMDLTSSLSVLNEMKISLSDVQELELHIGEKEALNILKASLTSTTALTDALKLKKRVKQEH